MISDNINNTKCSFKLFNNSYIGFREQYLRGKLHTKQ